MPVEAWSEIEEDIDPEPKEVRVKVVYDWDDTRYKEEAYKAAEKYNTFPEKLWETMKCEGTDYKIGKISATVQSYHKDTSGPNGREDSWGPAQFWLPAKHKTADGRLITKEIATNPIEAIDAMAYHFSIGNAPLWSCYKMLYR